VKIDGKETRKELHVDGSYRLRRADGPEFSASFSLSVESRDDGLLIKASMPLEAYVEAVLAAESADFHHAESMKAMAVAARTYVARFRGQHERDGFDFCDTTHCQAVRWNAVNPRIAAAVEATRGEILRFGGAPAETFYHQNCGGSVAAVNDVWPSIHEPYLAGHADPYCHTASDLKWKSTISILDLDQALRAADLASPRGWKTIEVVSRTASGRAQLLKLAGGNPPGVLVSASSLRFAVDRALGWNKIRSDLYEINSSGGQVIVSGRGSGHGVGLCQAGAEEMAREGKTYREILSFYYPGTQLSVVQPEAWQKRSSERFELFSTNPETDATVLPVAERILKEDENAVGWRIPFRVRLQFFPTMDIYRNSTGQPGWVVASTRGHTIRLQPLLELQRRLIAESTLRHEIYHLLVESHASSKTPLWFREGLVLYLSKSSDSGLPVRAMTDQQIDAVLRQSANREEMDQAYSAARRRVSSLVDQYGRSTVVGWLNLGLPKDLITGSASSVPKTTQE